MASMLSLQLTLVPFLIWLFCVGIAALAIGLFIKNMDLINVNAKEGFDSSIRITTCPASTATYITAHGDTNCCDGDIVDRQCNGTDVCSLSPSDKSGHGLMSCADWIIKEWQVRSTRFCAPSIPYYFGTMHRKQGDKEGCSASPCSQDGGAPQDTTKPTCKIYKTSVDEYGKADSCFNIKARDAITCPIPTATKEIVYTGIIKGNLMPALLRCTYIPPNGSSMNIPVHCNDVGRFETYINATLDQGWKMYINIIHQFINSFSVKDVNFCPASKAYYVDGTLLRKDAFGIPGSGAAGTINAQGGVDLPAACPTASTPGIANIKSVKIIGNGRADSLNLSQLVVKDENGNNVSKGRPTKSSGSPYGPPGSGTKGAAAEMANDGNEQSRSHPAEFHGKGSGSDFWQVDLDGPTKVSQVIVYNRSDCCQDRMKGYNIQLINSAGTVVWTSPALNASAVQTIQTQ